MRGASEGVNNIHNAHRHHKTIQMWSSTKKEYTLSEGQEYIRFICLESFNTSDKTQNTSPCKLIVFNTHLFKILLLICCSNKHPSEN
jgi:hypothetical protein